MYEKTEQKQRQIGEIEGADKFTCMRLREAWTGIATSFFFFWVTLVL